jgi:hypothetical protein
MSEDQLTRARLELADHMNRLTGMPVNREGLDERAFVSVLWDDLTEVPYPIPWGLPGSYAEDRANLDLGVPYGTYAWWVRRLRPNTT